MSYAEFVEWQAYYHAEPFGGARGDINTSLLAAVITNNNAALMKAVTGSKRTPKSLKPSDFMPEWWKGEATATPEGPAHVAGLLAKMQMFTGSRAVTEDEDG